MDEGQINNTNQKVIMDYLQAHSLRELLALVNTHNINCPNSRILKEDIVNIINEEGTFILLYYK